MKKRVVYVFLVLMICFIFVYIYSGLSNVQKMDVLDVIKLLQSLMNILKIPIFQFMLLIWKQLNIQLIY